MTKHIGAAQPPEALLLCRAEGWYRREEVRACSLFNTYLTRPGVGISRGSCQNLISSIRFRRQVKVGRHHFPGISLAFSRQV